MTALYGAAAGVYVDAGWTEPLPLPPRAKNDPPAGFTGYAGATASRSQVDQWAKTRPDSNLAIRMPNGVVGIDVDMYDGKAGEATLAALEADLGQLPRTYASSSRDDGSGIWFYRVPVGRRFRDQPGGADGGVELIQRHHRYAVVWPSIHPEGRTYRWFDPEAEEMDGPPDVSDLAELPWRWIEALEVVHDSTHAETATVEAVLDFIGRHTAATHPQWLNAVRGKLDTYTGSRHDHLVSTACWMMREAAAGLYSANDAVFELKAWWDRVMDDPHRRDSAEFGDAIAWAVAQTEANPDEVERKRQQAIDHDAKRALPTIDPAAAPDAPADTSSAAPASWSDAHVGEAFGETLRGRWLYCRALGGWLRWDGRRWAVDPGEAVHEEFRQWVIELGDRLWRQTGDGETMRQLARYRGKGKIDAAVTIARRLEHIAATPDEFDRHPHLLNVHNGVVDLRHGTLLPHDPTLRLTRLAGAEFHPDATHPDFDAVLEALQTDVRRWVQRLFGSAAYGEVVDDLLVVLDGTGSNGKTTMLKAASLALGEYAAPASTRLLLARGVSDEHPTLIADLYGRRLVYIEETPEGGALRMEQVKAITGGGKLKARFIGRDYFDFEPTHQLIVATNHRPAVNASDYAAWRRLRLVPFPRTYVMPHEAKPGDLVADRGLRARLGKPAQRAAALAWIVAGAVAWHADGGLGGCAAIDEATARWRRDEDVIHAWWADCLTPGGCARAADVYASFVAWCQQEGRRYISSNKEFVKRFTDHDLYRNHGVGKRSTNAGAFYDGISVVDVVGRGVGFQTPLHERPGVPPTTTTTSRGNGTPAEAEWAANGESRPW